MRFSDAGIVEGIFAVNKPAGKTSAQVVGNLRNAFNRSNLFASLVAAQRQSHANQACFQRKGGKRAKRAQVKIGHGGTLDPMATGVLIIGVGKGTKRLQSFLECTKTYEATVLFGAATDMYDTEGKVLKRAPYGFISRQVIERALSQFKGKILQRPPLYSALKMNGKRLCDYVREGKEIPRKIEERPVEVKELVVTEWLEGKDHGFSVREEEVDAESRAVAEAVLHLNENGTAPSMVRDGTEPRQFGPSSGRKRSLDGLEDEAVSNKKQDLRKEDKESDALMSGALQPVLQADGSETRVGESIRDKPVEPTKTELGDRPPAVKLRMTVTSGFYVRSLAHDLGEAVGSLACMCALVRTRQGDHDLGRNVLEFEDIEKGEDIWGSKVKGLIADSDVDDRLDKTSSSKVSS